MCCDKTSVSSGLRDVLKKSDKDRVFEVISHLQTPGVECDFPLK